MGLSRIFRLLAPVLDGIVLVGHFVRKVIDAIVVVFACAFGGALALAMLWQLTVLIVPGRAGYALKYDINVDHVYVDDQPHDCEWGKAPLGDKYCHYKKMVALGKNNGRVSDVYVSWEKVQD
jgi:hypothetical protein